MMKNLKFCAKEYYDYIEHLSRGEIYYILISKRLLLRMVVPVWMYFLAIFVVRSNVFWAMVGLPSIIVYIVFLTLAYPMWKACNISSKAYIIFHVVFLLLLKIISIPVSMLLEELWTLCF